MADPGANHRRADHHHRGRAERVFYPFRHPTPAARARSPLGTAVLARRQAALDASHGACTWQHQGIRCVARAREVLVLDHRDRCLCGPHLAVARRQGARSLR